MLNLLRVLVRKLGFDIVRYPPLHSHSGRMRRIICFHKINTILDVGANEGQFGISMRELAYDGRIVSFEPLSSAYKRLEEIAGRDPNWLVAPRMALGRTSGKISINVAENLESSSILPMSALHTDAAPASSYTGTEIVPLETLDEASHSFLESASVIYLKIDTQGFEAEVLAGATNVLSRAEVVQLEMSLAELYQGQPSYMELNQFMISNGFVIAELVPGFSDPRTGHLLQADGIFVKRNV
ncbi:MAG: FkbM family methyltransferase [Candidatus Accumulibacter sp. UW26]|jgi:FkbM family methyltransferase